VHDPHFRIGGERRARAAIDTRDLLRKAEKPFRKEPRLPRRDAIRHDDHAGCVDTGILQRGNECVTRRILPDAADHPRVASHRANREGRECAAARLGNIPLVFEHEHRRFARDACDRSIDILIQQHVPDDGDPLTAQPRHRIEERFPTHCHR